MAKQSIVRERPLVPQPVVQRGAVLLCAEAVDLAQLFHRAGRGPAHLAGLISFHTSSFGVGYSDFVIIFHAFSQSSLNPAASG